MIEMIDALRDLSIYVHIPFCKRKCNYCDFVSFGGCDISLQKDYINALCKEIGAFSLIAEEYKVVTVFIGGGTPSYIPAEYIGKILEKIRETFTVDDNCEITIEGNPDSLTRDKLILYRKYGINRLSIGLQSANDEMLNILGRIHNYDQFVAAYSRAREVGFTNINVDVMSGLPGESLESYVKTLAKVVAMQPEHISSYSLIIEDGTPLSENDELLQLLPSEEDDRKQYMRTKLLLGQSGYERYEISNYAKKGYECRHNLVYWTGGEYLGVGLSAASYMKIKEYDIERVYNYANDYDVQKVYDDENEYDIQRVYDDENGYDIQRVNNDKNGYNAERIYNEEKDYDMDNYEGANNYTWCRFRGVDDINEYIGRYIKYGSGYFETENIKQLIADHYKDIEVLSKKDMIEEFMFLGLRLMSGISIEQFQKRFNVSIDDIYGKVISKYVGLGCVIKEGDRLRLSNRGIDVSNSIFADFML